MQNVLNVIKPENLTVTADQLRVLLPYIWVFLGALVLILVSVIKAINPKWMVLIGSILTVIVGACASFQLIGADKVLLFNNMMISDSFSNLFNFIFLVSAGFTILISFKYLDEEAIQYPEYYILVLFSALGMMLMTSALDIIVIFIALELMSLSVYTLVGFRRADRKANEAAIKYFILGGAASAILLYGGALLYGMTGTTNVQQILAYAKANANQLPVLFSVGSWLVIAGFLFKVAAVPFHMWMPDVYEGAPTPVTGFMTTALKAAAFATFVRVFISLGYGTGLPEVLVDKIGSILWVLAILTMFVGNVIALAQTNLKRMLAYSSIAHTGYLLVGILAGSATGQNYSSVVMYLISYAIMNLGAFFVLTILSNRGDAGLNLHDVRGMAYQRPWLAFSLAVFLFSLAGIPPTAGFIAKYMLFYTAIEAGYRYLVVISVLCSAISVYYYLRVLVYMYMNEPVGNRSAFRTPIWSVIALTIMVVLTLQIGILPAQIIEIAKKAISSL